MSPEPLYILGAGMHPWGKWGRDFTEYGVVAARAALAEAGLNAQQIQFIAGADTIRNGYPGFIAGSSEYALSGWRVDGWRAAMEEAKLDTKGLLQHGDFGFASGVVAARALLERPDRATAIIASSDQMALATLERARRLGLEVPGELSIISFDNTPIVRFTQPPLTAVDQPIAALTARAVALLIAAKKAGEGGAESAPVVLSAALVERQSTAPPPPLSA